MAMEGGLIHPPAGVASEPAPDRPYVALNDAARRLHMDRRTVHAALVSGEIQGWARPGRKRLRWYVYEDQLPTPAPPAPLGAPDELARLRAEVAQLRAEVAEVRQQAMRDDVADVLHAAREEFRADVTESTASAVADLRARVVSLTETNLLLLEAHDDLSGAATALDSANQKYRRALSLFMTPGIPAS